MSNISTRSAPTSPTTNAQRPGGTRPDPGRTRSHLVQPAHVEWSEHPTLVGAQAVIDFARDELGVTLSKSMVRHATESRRLQVFKLSARNAYSPAGVVRFIESLARPVAGEVSA